MWTFVSVTSEVQASVELFECYNDASANITIGVVLERSAITDFPFSINKTHGLISIAINRTCQLMNGVANMRFVVIPCDVSGCISLKWGALFAEMHFTYAPHAVIGPESSPEFLKLSSATSFALSTDTVM
ncbi:hypothetical protein DPMN_111878 [Dreissena polymorpha]|uniref:Uncharacterized protein n=1 Tax=Dreissena polymorpha TaxID=45954 RepID=A0A9D4QPE7_DREPO|nr:hypothetical protein DPMN_111878 [Dreissena polymorpha]